MPTRRQYLQHTLRHSSLTAMTALWAASGLWPELSWAYEKIAFEAQSPANVYKALGLPTPVSSKDVWLTAPDIAENAAVVRLSFGCTLPNIRRMLLLVEKNPADLSALFTLTEWVEPNFTTTIKMAQSTDVFAVAVAADGKAFFAKKEVKITLGGCS
jgi:sulfur-oxidizing protein SoxY